MDKKRVMRLVDKATCLMECQVCGVQHYALDTPGGRLQRGSWYCDNGCVLPENRPRQFPGKNGLVPTQAL